MLKGILQNQGLTSKEIAIYNCLLEFGNQPASVIATKVGLPRTGCYLFLSKLCRRGFITQIIKNHITFYAVSNPEILLEKIKQQRAQEIRHIESLKNDLKTNRESLIPTNSKAHYYSGYAAIENLIAELFMHPPSGTHPPSRPRILLSTNGLNITQSIDFIPEVYLELQLLSTKKHYNLPSHYQHRKLPKFFDLGIDIIINNNQLAAICISENFAILIESPLISISQTKVFDFIWRFSRKF